MWWYVFFYNFLVKAIDKGADDGVLGTSETGKHTPKDVVINFGWHPSLDLAVFVVDVVLDKW
jgi:hypothetical protein